MSYYTIGSIIPTDAIARFSRLASKAEKAATGIKRKVDSHIKAKAKEGAISATPAIRAEVRSEVTPYVAGAAAIGVLALIVAMRK